MGKQNNETKLQTEVRKMIDDMDNYIHPKQTADYETQCKMFLEQGRDPEEIKVPKPESKLNVRLLQDRAREIAQDGRVGNLREGALDVYYNEKLLMVLEDIAGGITTLNKRFESLEKEMKKFKKKTR